MHDKKQHDPSLRIVYACILFFVLLTIIVTITWNIKYLFPLDYEGKVTMGSAAIFGGVSVLLLSVTALYALISTAIYWRARHSLIRCIGMLPTLLMIACWLWVVIVDGM